MATQPGKKTNVALRIILVLLFFILVAWIVWKNKDNAVALWFFGSVPPVPVILMVPGAMLVGAVLIYPFMALRSMRMRRRLREYERIFGNIPSRLSSSGREGEKPKR